MKTFIYYILFFGLFFTTPSHGLSLQSVPVKNTFQKTEKKFSFTSPDFEKSFFFSEEDFFNDEDDDEHCSVKKKSGFVPIAIYFNNAIFIKPFSKHLRNLSCYYSVFKFAHFEFISLNVLKI